MNALHKPLLTQPQYLGVITGNSTPRIMIKAMNEKKKQRAQKQSAKVFTVWEIRTDL